MKTMKLFALACATLVALTGTAFAGLITFVDATDGPSGNTTLAAGGVWTTNTVSAADSIWRARSTFGNGGPAATAFIYESNGGAIGEDCPRLATKVTGLAPGSYQAYAYFWAGGPPATQTNQFWLLRAGTTNSAGDLPLYNYLRTDNPTDYKVPDLYSTIPLATDFANTVTPVVAGRYMEQADLGVVTVGNDGILTVYVDDYAGAATVNQRTWYDGIGYTAVPEPATWIMLVLGIMGITYYSRKK